MTTEDFTRDDMEGYAALDHDATVRAIARFTLRLMDALEREKAARDEDVAALQTLGDMEMADDCFHSTPLEWYGDEVDAAKSRLAKHREDRDG